MPLQGTLLDGCPIIARAEACRAEVARASRTVTLLDGASFESHVDMSDLPFGRARSRENDSALETRARWWKRRRYKLVESIWPCKRGGSFQSTGPRRRSGERLELSSPDVRSYSECPRPVGLKCVHYDATAARRSVMSRSTAASRGSRHSSASRCRRKHSRA